MARLETIIDGSAEGLETAASRAIGILEGLQKVADKLKIDLFQATTVQELNSVGVALTAVTGRYNDYINTALRGNSVWQDQQAAKALENLDAKLRVVNGNAELFGRTIQTDKIELRAYQAAIDALLKAGLNPLDNRFKILAENVKRLTATLDAAKTTDPFARFRPVPGMIANIENRLRNLRLAMKNATDTRDINRYILRIQALEKELGDITTIGPKVSDSVKEAGSGAVRAGQGFSQFSLELGRVVQDAPYAANNFGSIGNNLTRMVEVFPNYIAQLRAAAVAQGLAATSTNLWRLALRNLFTGINGISIAFSAVISAITVYSLWQTRANKATKEGAAEAAKLARANMDLARSYDVLREKRAEELRDDLTKSISAYENALLKAEQAAASEAKELENLYKVATNDNIARKDRIVAVDQLQKQYPAYFKNISDETIMAGQATGVYDKLTTAIMNTARARVYGEALQENVEKEVANLRTIAELNREITDIERRRIELQSSGGVVAGGEYLRLEKAIKDAREQIQLLTIDNDRLGESSYNLQQRLKAAQEAGGLIGLEKGLKETASNAQKLLSYTERIAAIAERSAAREDQAGLGGLDLDVAKIMTEYQAMYSDIEQLRAKINADTKLSEKQKTDYLVELDKVRAQLGIDEAARLSAEEIKWAKETQNTIAGILEEAGVNRTNSLQGELSKIDAHYAELRRKYEGHQEILDAINEAHETRRAQATEDWAAKLTDIRIEYARKLNETQSQILKRQLDSEFRARTIMAKRTLHTEEERLKAQQKLQEEYWKRLEEIQQFERMENLALEFGEAFSRAFETSLSNGKNIFEQIYQEFRRLIIRMIAQQAALKAANIFGQLFGVGNVGDSSRGGSQATFGDLLKGLAGIFGNSGSGGKWVTSVGNIFKNSGQGGQWIGKLGQVFTSNSGGGGFLRALGSIFSSVSGGGGGGWFGKLLGSIFGGSKYRSGNFPTGNFGGGNFPQYDNPQRVPAFVPGLQAGTQTENITLNARIGHDAIYLSNKMGAQKNDRFYGGK